jgi:uncharacterized protein YecE (DUF72 family)
MINMETETNPAVFYIGTSGWTYDHWKGNFYPDGLTRSHWFDFYARRFNAVEVNATFYRTFGDPTFEKWKNRAPKGFGYTLKAPKSISHRKLLRDVEDDIQAFCRSAGLLGDAYKMILLQVSPDMPYDHGLLRSALQAFPEPGRVAVEFRAGFWFNPHTESLLSSVGAVFCNVDSPRQRMTEVITSERTYLRLHGRDHWYTANYSTEDLKHVAEVARRLADRGAKQVGIFFNNDFGGYAPANALELQKYLAG